MGRAGGGGKRRSWDHVGDTPPIGKKETIRQGDSHDLSRILKSQNRVGGGGVGEPSPMGVTSAF